MAAFSVYMKAGFLNVSMGPVYSAEGQEPQNCAVGFGPSKPMVTGSNPVGIANNFK
jgi:hypothetical protein